MNKTINIQYETSYSTSGELTAATKNIWLVCHGYGQLSEYFIKNFDCLDPQTNFIIAPQAISKFYLGDFTNRTGRVGASWMTKHDREREIENYIRLLSSIYQQETEGKETANCKVILFGFSQGTATICRWALQSGIDFDALVLWAGSFPHDVDHQAAAEVLKTKDFRLTIGTKDEFFDQSKIDEHLQQLNELGLHPKVSYFDGTHKIYDEELLKLGF